MVKFVFVVLSVLLVGGALGDAALGNYYKDVVREQHKVINEMNQNFTELEKASEKLIDLGFYVGKHTLPPKTVKITKTVAVQVPVPFPVAVPQPVPVPVPVNKPVPVPVPTLVAIPVESTAQTATTTTAAAAGTVVTGVATAVAATSPTTVADADPASSQAHPSTVQVQEYVQSFPIHSVYDAGDDYNPMEGNRLALAEHTASPTESTLSKPSPSSLQQLEEYQQRQRHHHHHHRQHYHLEKSAQAGSYASAKQYHRQAASGAAGKYYGGAQVQAAAHSAAKFGSESHALQPTAQPYGDATSGHGYKLHTPAFAHAPDTAYSVAAGYSGGGQLAPSAASASSESYRLASDQLQRGGSAGGAYGAAEEDYGRTGSGSDGGVRGVSVGGGEGGGLIVGGGGGGGAGRGSTDGAHSYVKYSQAVESEAIFQETIPHFESQIEALQDAVRGREGQEEEAAAAAEEEGTFFGAAAAGGQGAEVHGKPAERPFQTVRESYPRYEKPDFARYHGPSDAEVRAHDHHGSSTGTDGHGGGRHGGAPFRGGGSSSGAGGAGSGSVLTEGFDHPAFKPLPGSGQEAAAAAGATAAGAGTGTRPSEAHRYAVQGERTYYPKVSSAGYHHSHSHHKEPSGEAHQDLRHQADAAAGGGSPAERFPFYRATKDDPHFSRTGFQSYRAGGPTSGPAAHRPRYSSSKESSASGLAQTQSHHHHHHHHHHAGSYNTFTEHHSVGGHEQHERPSEKYTGGYEATFSTAKPTILSVPSDAHLYPNYSPGGQHQGRNYHHHHHILLRDGDHHHHGHTDASSGRFQYHFHNVHDTEHQQQHQQQSAASEHHHQYAIQSDELGAGHADGLVSSYDPPASGQGTYHHFHDDRDDLLAGASEPHAQFREDSSQ